VFSSTSNAEQVNETDGPEAMERARVQENASMWRTLSYGYESAAQYVDVTEWVGV